MGLRTKTLVIIGTVVAVLLGALFLAAWLVVLEGFRQEEERLVRADLERAINAISREQETLFTLARDYANWDDTYEFMADHNDQYVSANLADTTFLNLGLSLLAWVDEYGNVVFGATFDSGLATSRKLNAEEITELFDPRLLKGPGREEAGSVGFERIAGDVVMVARAPVLTTDATGPSRGTLVFGKHMRDEQQAALADVTQLDVRLIDPEKDGSAGLPPGVDFGSLISGGISTRAIDRDTIAGYGTLETFVGLPALIVKIQEPRTVYNRGRTVLLTFIVGGIAVAALLIILLFILLRVMVLSRLDYLKSVIKTIRDSKGLGTRLQVSGSDEISDLSGVFNDTLQALDREHHERSLAELRLTQSEQRFRALADSANEAILTVDDESRIRFANPGAAAVFRRPSDEMLSRSISEIIPDYDSRATSPAVEGTGQSGTAPFQTGMVVTGVTSDGAELPLEITVGHFHESGRLYSTVVARDVTERVRAQEQIAFQRLVLQSQAEASPDGILVVDGDDKVLSINRRFMQLWRFGESEVSLDSGNQIEDLIALKVQDAGAFRSRSHALSASSDAYSREELRLLDGRVFDRYTAPVQDAAGQHYGRVWFYSDVTERKMAEDHLARLARVNLIMSVTHSIAAEKDTPGQIKIFAERLCNDLPADAVIVLASDADQQTLRPVEITSKRQVRLEGSESYSVLGEILAGPVRGVSSITDDIRVRTGSFESWLAGSGLHSCISVPIGSDEGTATVTVIARESRAAFHPADLEVVGAIAERLSLAMRDARLRERLQSAYDDLKRAQGAVIEQERLRALGQMASGIAHDINNSLSPIVGFTELLLVDKARYDPRTQEYLSLIRTSAGDISQIVLRLREFYRRRSETDGVEMTQVSKLLSEVVELTRPKWKDIAMRDGADIAVHIDTRDSIPEIACNPSHLREALTNLVFNAVDAMPQGGTLTLRSFAVTSAGDQERVAVEVIDTGLGMDEETRRRCLEPFFTTKGERGTGLGLSMVQGFARGIGGSLDIISSPGRGTSVRIELPLRPLEMQAAEKTQSAASSGRPLKLLVVDDEPILRQMLSEMLTLDGHRVITAESGGLAVDLFRLSLESQEPFEILITDIGMPGMDGWDVIAEIDRIRPGTPAIIVSGWSDEMKRGQIPDTVPVVSVSKPATLFAMRDALGRLMGRSSK